MENDLFYLYGLFECLSFINDSYSTKVLHFKNKSSNSQHSKVVFFSFAFFLVNQGSIMHSSIFYFVWELIIHSIYHFLLRLIMSFPHLIYWLICFSLHFSLFLDIFLLWFFFSVYLSFFRYLKFFLDCFHIIHFLIFWILFRDCSFLFSFNPYYLYSILDFFL
jgi:hypothetical protein